MEMEKAIPTGYMTVGQVARKMDVTVRTLQHYDREGLLSPTAISAGGRRLYTDKDIVLLHQILAMRHLGFSLKDIKDRLPKLETPEQVACALEEQAGEIEQKIRSLSQALQEIQALRQEVLQMGKNTPILWSIFKWEMSFTGSSSILIRIHWGISAIVLIKKVVWNLSKPSLLSRNGR